jgi:hypothetical protein
MGLSRDYHGHSLGVWALTIVYALIMTYFREQRRKERRQGINPYKGMATKWSAITCPKCHAAWPGGYEARSHRELMWHGVVCPECGCEYDDQGRERRKG